jgi:hypothetical protein
VTLVDVTPEQFATGVRGVLPDGQVEGLLEDYGHYRRGEAADVCPTVAGGPGRRRARLWNSPGTTSTPFVE